MASRRQRAAAASRHPSAATQANAMVAVSKLAPRADRIAAKTTLMLQQRAMRKAARLAISEYLRAVKRAMAHTAIRAAAPNQPDDEDDLGDDVDLNQLDQSSLWPDILNRTILAEINTITLGLGPQKLLPAAVTQINAWRAQWLHARTQALMGVPDQISKQIRDAIQADADLNGTSPYNAANIVKDLLNPDAPTWASRADTIARTEVMSANNQGSLEMWGAVHQSLAPVGGQVYKTWLATSDSLTRPDHIDVDGTEVGIDESFSVGESTMNGPGDESADPGETINCRCTLTYRVDDGTGGDEEVDSADAKALADASPDDGGDESGDDAMTAALAPEAAPADDKPYEPKPYQKEADENVTCPNCGKNDDDDAVYCDQCGFKLEGATGVKIAPSVADPEDAAAPVTAAVLAPAGPPQPADGTPSEAAPAVTPGAMQWSGVLATLDAPSSDGRMILSSGLTFRTFPLPLSYQCEGEHGGEEAGRTVIVGRILTGTISGNQVLGTGDFLDSMDGSSFGAIEQVAAGIGGVSLDLPVSSMIYMAPGPDGVLIPVDPMQFMGDPDQIIQVAEISEVAGATIVSVPAFADARISLVDAMTMPNTGPVAAPMVADAADPQGPLLTATDITFPDGTVLKVGDTVNVVGAMGADTPTMGLIESIDPTSNQVTVSVEDPTTPGQTNTVTVDASALAVVGAADNTGDAASGAPTDSSPAVGGPSGGADGIAAGLTAALAFPGLTEEHIYPAEWFSLPDMDEVAAHPHLQVTDDGRVFGLLAQSGSCHIGFGSECVAPPTSPTGYSYFHVGDIKTDQGLLAVGKLTVGGGHADMRLGWQGTVEHYDNAGAAAAVARAYDTPIGVVLAGALLPQATPEQIAALRRNDLSGDWRPIGGHRELVAALSVNTAGFQLTPRSALAADGRPLALVAAGVVHDTTPPATVTLPSGATLTESDMAMLASAFNDVLDQRARTDQERRQRRVDAGQLRRRLERDALKANLTIAR